MLYFISYILSKDVGYSLHSRITPRPCKHSPHPQNNRQIWLCLGEIAFDAIWSLPTAEYISHHLIELHKLSYLCLVLLGPHWQFWNHLDRPMMWLLILHLVYSCKTALISATIMQRSDSCRRTSPKNPTRMYTARPSLSLIWRGGDGGTTFSLTSGMFVDC